MTYREIDRGGWGKVARIDILNKSPVGTIAQGVKEALERIRLGSRNRVGKVGKGPRKVKIKRTHQGGLKTGEHQTWSTREWH